MQSSSPHAQFFSALKQVEKRLKLENPSPLPILSPPRPPSPPPPLPPPVENVIDTQVDSLSSAIYLYHTQNTTNTTNSSSTLQESDPPHEFLSNSPDFCPTQKTSFEKDSEINQETSNEVESGDLDDIELLMQLLGLSDENELKKDGSGFDSCFGCDDEFYGKIVGVKGPKCVKELQRLEGWIEHFMNGGGEKKEPLRLAHLLLSKAAFLSSLEGSSDGFQGFEFPTTIDDFLHNDPPID